MIVPRSLIFLSPVLLAVSLFAQSADEHWVATWGAAMQQYVAVPAPPPPPPGAPAAPTPPVVMSNFHNQTVRMMVPVTIAGRKVRVHFSNAFGASAITIGSAHAALHAKGSAIVEGSDRPLTFGGKSSITLPVGASVVSDTVDLEVPALADVAVSVYIPGDAAQPTLHRAGLHTTYISPQGDFSGKATVADAVISQSWYWLSGIDVAAPRAAAAIVAFGDSITDGARSTPDTDHSWPSLLAPRLHANAATANIAVVNRGIGGNRVLRDGTGANALARFDRDVLGTSGVKWLMLLEGINDIGQGTRVNADPANVITADELIAGLRQMAERAHIHGIKVMGATLTPYEGAAYYSEAGEQVRQTVNTWIRTSGTFDAVVDFEKAVSDPQHPLRFKPEYDSGDHLHPGDMGYKAMADAVDLTLFGGKVPAVTKTKSTEKKNGLSALRQALSR